ncbi:MAG: DUF805 domain-containing protein [Methyloceanibacter sp.]|uniref:DUF805 domain-containing protein n=1 Tax=Methyloceanibacter sp. TaxID=1965321 RepID=UPI003D6CCF2C
MTTIILSYRREDTSWIAGRIHDRLKSHYGNDSVFMDIDSIPFGLDFREHIQESLENCDILLAIIGPDWTAPKDDGQARIFDDTDWVRIEIEAALAKKIPVIPVLIDGTRVPPARDLPEGVRDIVFRQAADIDAGRDFHPHMDRLIGVMDQLLARARQPEVKSAEAPLRPTRAKVKSEASSPAKKATGATTSQVAAPAPIARAQSASLRDTFFSLGGRLERKKFWAVLIASYVAMFGLTVLLGVLAELAGGASSDISPLAGLSPLAWTWVLTAIGVKPLHDFDWSGYWLALPIVIGLFVPSMLGIVTNLGTLILFGGTSVAACVLFALGLPNGTAGPNRYGPDPLGGSPKGAQP